MHRFIALAALAAAFSLPVHAGDHGSGRHADRIKEDLGLNDEQAAQVQEIMKEQHEKRRALFDQAAGDRDKVKSRMEALHEETMARLGKILDAGQMAKMQQMHEERREKWKEGRDERHAFLDDLQLTDDQKSQVKQILKEQHDKKRALFDADGDREAKRGQMDALHQETKTRLATVLNEEQLAKFEEAHDMRKGKRDRFRKRGMDKEAADAPQ